MKKYNHVATVYFSIDSEYNDEQTENISSADLIAACRKRLDYLEANPQEADEAFHIVERGDYEV